jgi:hypothetical protein
MRRTASDQLNDSRGFGSTGLSRRSSYSKSFPPRGDRLDALLREERSGRLRKPPTAGPNQPLIPRPKGTEWANNLDDLERSADLLQLRPFLKEGVKERPPFRTSGPFPLTANVGRPMFCRFGIGT